MVRARLHIVCGNCGNSELNYFEYSHQSYFTDNEDILVSNETCIVCKNCSTIHHLNDNAENTNRVELNNDK